MEAVSSDTTSQTILSSFFPESKFILEINIPFLNLLLRFAAQGTPRGSFIDSFFEQMHKMKKEIQKLAPLNDSTFFFGDSFLEDDSKSSQIFNFPDFLTECFHSISFFFCKRKKWK